MTKYAIYCNWLKCPIWGLHYDIFRKICPKIVWQLNLVKMVGIIITQNQPPKHFQDFKKFYSKHLDIFHTSVS